MPTDPADGLAPRLKVKIDNEGGATIIQCSGWLTAEFTPTFKTNVKRLIPSSKKIILDLSRLTYMDSSGIGAVVGLYVSAKTAHCDFKLVNLNKYVRELLGLAQLLHVFEPAGPYPI
jgi:anti-sigma B factor antagonist